MALTAVSLSMFVPVQLRNLETSCETVRLPVDLLEAMPGDGKDLVFANWLVPGTGISWHLFPPPPSPGLDDDVIFVRLPSGPDRAARMQDFWRRRFPDRRPWVYDPGTGGEPQLIPLLPPGEAP